MEVGRDHRRPKRRFGRQFTLRIAAIEPIWFLFPMFHGFVAATNIQRKSFQPDRQAECFCILNYLLFGFVTNALQIGKHPTRFYAMTVTSVGPIGHCFFSDTLHAHFLAAVQYVIVLFKVKQCL